MHPQDVFKALADPTRREILRRLRHGALSAGEIAEAFPISRASLSHHFNALKAAQLVRATREGQHIIYELNTSVFEDVARIFFDIFGDGENRK